MKNLLSLFTLMAFILLVTSACYRPPEFPVEPSISFNDIKFYETTSVDSMVVTINFEDGDGNLGLRRTEIDRPYHPFEFVMHAGQPLKISSNDTMPPFTRPYNCINYKAGKWDNNTFISHNSTRYNDLFPGQAPDTFYTEPNLFNNNFLVDFYVKRDNSFEKFDWITAPNTGCGESVNGRFMPLFDAESANKPLSGTLTYAIITNGFIPYFRNDTLKLSIRIIDRDLNISNVIETPEFTLQEIQASSN
jgi:hypothetical protein